MVNGTNDTAMTGQQITTQAAKEPTAWEAWDAAVRHFVDWSEKVEDLAVGHAIVKACREESGDTHTEE